MAKLNTVIVGAGLAGLSAAWKLKERGIENYVVLDGSDRAGGRVKTADLDVDFGGAYIGQSQNYIQFLARRYQLHILPTYLARTREWLFEFSEARLKRFPGNDHLDFPGGLNAGAVLVGLDAMALEVREFAENPWDYPEAAGLDAKTAREWMDEQIKLYDTRADKTIETIGMSEDTAAAFTAAVRCAFSLEPKDVSFFFLIYYAALAGSFAALVDIAGGQGAAEGARFMFGADQLVKNLVAEVGEDKVLRNKPVDQIIETSGGVTVKSGQQSWEADYVIVAMSPPASKNIKYSLRSEHAAAGDTRRRLCEKMAGCQGKTIKGFVRFKEPVWRRPKEEGGEGLMGFFLSAGPRETCPVSWTLDNMWDPSDAHWKQFFRKETPKDQQPVNPICRLMTFIVAGHADYWTENGKTKADRAKAVIAQLQRAYGFRDADLFDEKDRFSNYIEEDWLPLRKDGVPAPAAMMPKNTLFVEGRALRAPIGRIHFAGSETALEWCGYMNGAIESGFRSGRDVAARIQAGKEAIAAAATIKKAIAPVATLEDGDGGSVTPTLSGTS